MGGTPRHFHYEQDAAFVYAMENVLEVYAQPYDKLHPVIWLDGSPKQLLEDKRAGIQQKDGSWKVDSEYKNRVWRNFTCFLNP